MWCADGVSHDKKNMCNMSTVSLAAGYQAIVPVCFAAGPKGKCTYQVILTEACAHPLTR